MPAEAGIAILAAQLAMKLFEGRARKKKGRQEKQRKAAGREVTESLGAPPAAPQAPTPPPFGPAPLTGNVYDPTPLTRMLGREGVEVAPWEFPAWAGQPGRAAQLAEMGLPVGKEFVGMQGEARKPIGAQERLDAMVPKRKRKGDVGPEAALAARLGATLPGPAGIQFHLPSALSRQAGKEAVRTRKAKGAAEVTEQQQEERARKLEAAYMTLPPGPVPPAFETGLINTLGVDRYGKLRALKQSKEIEAEDAVEDDRTVQIRNITDRMQQLGIDDPAQKNLVRMMEAKGAGKEAADVLQRMGEAQTQARERAVERARAELEPIIEMGLEGPVSESMARQAMRLSVAAGETPAKAMPLYAWLKETDPEQREINFARYTGGEVDFWRQRANERFVADIERDIDSGLLREIGDLEERLMSWAANTGAEPSEEMMQFELERLTEKMSEWRARSREAEADRGGQDGVTGGSGGEPTIKPPTSTERTIQGRKARAVGSGGSSAGTQDFKYGAVVEFTPPDRPGVTMVGKVSSTPAKDSTERTVTVTRGTHFTDEKGKRRVTGETMSWPMDVLELRRSSRPLVIKTLYKSDEDEKQSGNVGDTLLDELGF